MDEEGIAIFTSDTHEVDKATILEACKECPVDALVVLDASGNQLHP